MAVLRRFVAIFSNFVSFTKLKFRRSFWGAKSWLVQKLWHKTQMRQLLIHFYCSHFDNYSHQYIYVSKAAIFSINVKKWGYLLILVSIRAQYSFSFGIYKGSKFPFLKGCQNGVFLGMTGKDGDVQRRTGKDQEGSGRTRKDREGSGRTGKDQ